jgi:hypothetical protein
MFYKVSIGVTIAARSRLVSSSHSTESRVMLLCARDFQLRKGKQG